MTDSTHNRPHGHHHDGDTEGADSRARRRAESEAQPFVDDCAPEREEMRSAIQALEAELARERENALRAMADFQNLQRRTMEQEPRMRQAATGAVVRHVIPVLDNFDLALAQDPARMTVAGAVDGLRLVRTELIKALEKAGVELIQPKPGDSRDPHQAEAIMHQPGPGVAPGHVSLTLQPGYRLGESVLRPAKVAVAP